jgi:carboxylesterase
MPEPAVLLVHGLGGTQYDLGSMHKRLKNAGFVTHSLTLPGHGTTPEDLAGVRAEQWVEAVSAKYVEVAARHDELHLMGMCMGALLAAEVAKRSGHGGRGRLVLLAPPVFIDGWSTPWYRFLRPLLYGVPGLPERMRIEEEDPYGIKNEQLRAIVKAKFERGENFHYRWVPLACVREVDRLRGWVMRGLERMACETLVVHAREDELTSLRSADFIVERVNRGAPGRARVVVLENSYHMVAVDNDREIVASSVLAFLGAQPAAGLGGPADDPRMSAAEQLALAARACDALATGGPAGLWPLGIPDFAWYMPGAHRGSGAARGSKGLPRLRRWGEAVRFVAFGTPVDNAGVVVVPGTLVHDGLTSVGTLALWMRAGRLLEARWFPDDPAREDAHFGGSPEPDGPSPAERAFEQAARDVKSLPTPPDQDALLELYALYKQGSMGDAAGERPGLMDPVGRAKFDAWASRRGTSRDDAMAQYVALVGRLRERTTA